MKIGGEFQKMLPMRENKLHYIQMKTVMSGASTFRTYTVANTFRNRSDKRVQLFINEVSSSPVQIIEQHPYAKPEVRRKS